MGRIFRRPGSKTYYADLVTPHGKRVRRSLKTRDPRVARERLREAELAATPQARGRRQRLSEAIDHVIGLMHDRAEATREMYREKARRIATTLGDPHLHEVTRDMLYAYIERRLSDEDGHGGAAPHTVQKELIVIRRALREAHERGVLSSMPPMPRFAAKYKPRETWLTPAEFELVCGALGRPRRQETKYSEARREKRKLKRRKYEHVPIENRVLWLALAALAGANYSEVEGLDWADVDLERGWLRIRGTKRESRDRRVPIAPALAARLRAAGPRTSGRVVAPWRTVRAQLARACERAGIGKRVSPNDLRRTFASWLVQAGVPLLTVATLMGHSSTRMVERVYGRLAPSNLEEAISGLPSFAALPQPDDET